MKDIKHRFELIRTDKKYEGWGDYICLCEAIKGRNYKRSDIFRAFNVLIKDYYDVSEKKEYQEYLCEITKINKLLTK